MKGRIDRLARSDRRARREERESRRRSVWIVVLGSLGVLLAGTGIALALWPATGSGSGSAQASTAESLTITAAVAPTAELYPGASGALQFTVTNPNPYPVSFTAVDYGTVTSSDQSNCPASNLTTAADGALGTPIAAPADSTSGALTIPGAVTLSSSAPTGCQGVTFTVALSLSGTQT